VSRPDAILFDLDGTLIDSVPDIAAAVNAMLREAGREEHTVEVIRSWVGRGLSVLMHRSLTGGDAEGAEIGAHADAIAMFRRHYKECCTDRTTVFEGGKELLQWLSDQSIKTAVVTNKPEAFARQIVESLSIRVDVVIGAADHRPLKPDPTALHEAAERLRARTAWMVGDTRFDLHAARAAGMKFIGVQLEGDQGRNISEIAAPHEPVFESLSDMHEWLSQEVFDV